MATPPLPDSAQRVQRALLAAGLAADVVVLPLSARTAADAAAAVGCAVAQIVKSLLFRQTASAAPLLVLASGANRVDETLVAALIGSPIEKADAAFVRAATGYAIGGVPPLGHGRPIDTVVDEDLLRFDVVWAAGGTPHTVFAVAPGRLAEVVGGRVARVALATKEK